MYRTEILRALGLIIALLCSVVVSAASAQKNVYADFQKKIEILEGQLKKEKNLNKRYDTFLSSFRELSNLRAKNPRQDEEKELNMSLFMDTLAFLPVKKDFQVKKCGEYKKEAQDMMKSYDKKQKEPFVERAIQIVDLICAK